MLGAAIEGTFAARASEAGSLAANCAESVKWDKRADALHGKSKPVQPKFAFCLSSKSPVEAGSNLPSGPPQADRFPTLSPPPPFLFRVARSHAHPPSALGVARLRWQFKHSRAFTTSIQRTPSSL
jgi:hypothetical protein